MCYAMRRTEWPIGRGQQKSRMKLRNLDTRRVPDWSPTNVARSGTESSTPPIKIAAFPGPGGARRGRFRPLPGRISADPEPLFRSCFLESRMSTGPHS